MLELSERNQHQKLNHATISCQTPSLTGLSFDCSLYRQTNEIKSIPLGGLVQSLAMCPLSPHLKQSLPPPPPPAKKMKFFSH